MPALRGLTPPVCRGEAWRFYILPYIEAENESRGAIRQGASWLIAGMAIKTYFAPLGTSLTGGRITSGNFMTAADPQGTAGTSNGPNFLVFGAKQYAFPTTPPPLYGNPAVAPATREMVADGRGNLTGTRVRRHQQHADARRALRLVPRPGDEHAVATPGPRLDAAVPPAPPGTAHVGFGSALPPQSKPLLPECDFFRPQALSSSGCNVCLCDGSVRVVNTNVSGATWANALDPSDGRVLGAEW